MLVGKTYAKFHIDVGIGGALVGEPEELIGDDVLDFVGIEPVKVLAIPKPLQFAEKAHAYSFPWSGRLNTRTKDLVDLVLLIERGPPELAQIRSALEATFDTRRTHPRVPSRRLRPRGQQIFPGWLLRQGFRQPITWKRLPPCAPSGTRWPLAISSAWGELYRWIDEFDSVPLSALLRNSGL